MLLITPSHVLSVCALTILSQSVQSVQAGLVEMGGASDAALAGYIPEETLSMAQYLAPVAQSMVQGQTEKATQSVGTAKSTPNVVGNVYDHFSFTKVHPGKRVNDLIPDTLDLVIPTQYKMMQMDQVDGLIPDILDVFGTYIENRKRVENPISGITQDMASLATSKAEDFSKQASDGATPYFDVVEKPIHSGYKKVKKQTEKIGNAIINEAVDTLITSKNYNTEEHRRDDKSLIKVNNEDFKPATLMLGKVTIPLSEELDQPVAPRTKRDTTLPPIEILPGARPASSKVLKDVQKGSGNAIVKVIQKQSIFRRSSNFKENGRMSRQRRAVAE